MKVKKTTIILEGHPGTENIVSDLESLMGVTLMAKNHDDEVNGYINTMEAKNTDGDPVTMVAVHLYEQDEASSEEDPNIKSVIDKATKGMTKANADELKKTMVMTLGGHTTKFKKASELDQKLNKLDKWVKNLVK